MMSKGRNAKTPEVLMGTTGLGGLARTYAGKPELRSGMDHGRGLAALKSRLE